LGKILKIGRLFNLLNLRVRVAVGKVEEKRLQWLLVGGVL